MKIIDKIVTSVTQPQLTNVMWHNPDTGEFKIFGGKGWEPAGGNPGLTGSSFSEGYPVVTVENDFNIEAEPNTFYNIKNSADSEVNISCNQLELAPTKVYFTYDGSDTDGFGAIFLLDGVNLFPDTTKEGYNYKSLVNISAKIVIEIYFTNDIIQGGNTVAYASVFGQEIELPMNNINILKTGNVINEFVFNVNCPCTIQFENVFSWNNDNAPDLTQTGVCTISIVNGVGCYTFV